MTKMLRALLRPLSCRAWWRSQRPHWTVFQEALVDPRHMQERLLLSVLRRNVASLYGRQYRFQTIRTVQQFQDRVPSVTYEELSPWIEAIKGGRQGVLTAEPVLFFEKTSGSVTAAKYIPYTRSLLREFRAAIGAWMGNLAAERPGLIGGRAYWSISPITQPKEVTASGLRVGVEGDSGYFGPLERWVVQSMLAVPEVLSQVCDVETHRYLTLRFLLEASDLTWISVWNPSFLTLLVRPLRGIEGRLIEDIHLGTITPPNPLPLHVWRALGSCLVANPRRAKELEDLLRPTGSFPLEGVWPRLSLISCWTSAEAARSLPELQALFPHVEIQGKGLLATEGVVSIPRIGYPGAALSVTSHFYEFLDLNNGTSRPKLVDALEGGHYYTVLLTTGGGLYRYRLDDTVLVVGKIDNVPLVEFVGKASNVSDLCGEKLSESFVRAVLEEGLATFQIKASFIMVAPEWGQSPSYVVFLQSPDGHTERFTYMVSWMEGRLLSQYHYAYCRQLGQLGPLRGFRIEGNAEETYLRFCQEQGQKMGTAKQAALHRSVGWSSRFPGTFVELEAERAHAGSI